LGPAKVRAGSPSPIKGGFDATIKPDSQLAPKALHSSTPVPSSGTSAQIAASPLNGLPSSLSKPADSNLSQSTPTLKADSNGLAQTINNPASVTTPTSVLQPPSQQSNGQNTSNQQHQSQQ
jgi:hypothetical protein